MGSCTSSSSVAGDVMKKKNESKAALVTENKTAAQEENQPSPRYLEDAKGKNNLMPQDSVGGSKKVDHRANNKKYKFREVGAQDDVIFERFQRVDTPMGQDSMSLLVKNLKVHSFFSNLSTEDLKRMVSKMFFANSKKGEFVFKQGDKATCFFVIEQGKVNVYIGDVLKKSLQRGEGFGELALLYNAPRSASIQCEDNTTFWVLERKTFKQIVEEVSKKQFKENREFLGKIRFFEAMTDAQKDSIANNLILQNFKQGELIIAEGDQASSYYIVKHGTAECIKEGKVVRTLIEGESFGEQALYNDGVRSLSVRAGADCVCLGLSRDALQSVLGAKIQEVIQGNWSRWAIEKNTVLSKLTKLQTEKWILSASIKRVPQGTVLLEKSSTMTEIFIVINGELKCGQATYSKGTVFDDRFLYPSSKTKSKIGNDLVAVSDSEVSVISTALFFKLLGGTLEEVFVKNLQSHENKLKDDDRSQIRKKFENMKLSDLNFIKKLGEGQFGHVFLVKHNTENELYALKGISKHQIAEQKLERHTRQEKDVLEKINFPFLLTMYRTFKDDNFVYFLLGFVHGMELFEVIRKMDLLDNDESRYFTGSILLAIEYLHSKNIIYRDLKPENVMVDKRGVLKVVDMGTAKLLRVEDGMKTFTILGTPHYMAPEILTSKGYGLNADLWSIGIILFEFMCGSVPFGEDCEDPYDVYQKVMTQKLVYPGMFLVPENRAAQSLIELLLSRNPEARKNGSTFASLKAHKWFDHFDWDKLADMKIKPPYIPPSDLIINEAEISRVAKMNIPISVEIEKSAGKFRAGKGPVPKTDWDRNF